MTKYEKIPNRLKILQDLKEGNEQRIVAIEVGIRLGERRKISAGKEEIWAIEKRITDMKDQRREMYDAINVINDEIIEENKNEKKS